jgi:hypothetical protein
VLAALFVVFPLVSALGTNPASAAPQKAHTYISYPNCYPGYYYSGNLTNNFANQGIERFIDGGDMAVEARPRTTLPRGSAVTMRAIPT